MKLISLLALLWFADPQQPLTKVDANTPAAQQIAIARSAAPDEVSKDAAVYVLGKKGYELAVKGSNGFTCLIERERADTVAPECFDAEGSRTTVQAVLFREAERAKGATDKDIDAAVAAGYKQGRFHAPAKPGIVYMMSNQNYVVNPSTQKVIHFPGHLMFYAPYATTKTVGSGKGAPYIVHPGLPDALMIVVPTPD
jgi:hypothetical protein